MSIIDKAASKRSGSGRSSLVDRAMSRNPPSGEQAAAEREAPERETARQPAGVAPAAGAAAPAEAAPPEPVRPEPAHPDSPSAAPAAAEPARPGVGRVEAVAPRRSAPKTSRRFRLDWEALERDRLIGTSRHARRLQSEIRTIKSRLMSSVEFFDYKRGARGRGGENVVLVTSSRQGEGKSFTAINLALSLALEDGVQVLLVDADAVQSSVTRFFGLGGDSKGLLDRLADPGMDLSEVLWRAEGATLSVLPVGRGIAKAAELYGSPAMSRLLDELSNRYPDRLIIFDAPPMLAANEPMVLSKQIQQVLMVVEAGKTTEATIRTALDVLGQRERVSLVLNHCTIRGDEVQSSSYGYGYGYGQGSEPGEATASRGRQAA